MNEQPLQEGDELGRKSRIFLQSRNGHAQVYSKPCRNVSYI